MSFSTTPTKPIKRQVKDPITNMKFKATSEYSNNGDKRATIKTPAVTIVAA